VPIDLLVPHATFGAALAINASGTIVGVCELPDADSSLGYVQVRACSWGRTREHTIEGLGGPESYAYDINDRGWAVGSADTAAALPNGGYVHHAFLHDGRTTQDLGTLGGLGSFALAVNNRGDVVGSSFTRGVERHAFRWRQGVMHDLGTLGDPYSEALDVNDQGLVVGWSGGVLKRAVLWAAGDDILDLNTLIEPESEWELESATAIDNRGRILVNARRERTQQAVLLIPE